MSDNGIITPSAAAQAISAWMTANGVTIESDFIPWSQSRAKDDFEEYPTRSGKAKRPRRSLNWKVRLLKAGRVILETDYGAGIGNCPAYKFNVSPAERNEYESRIVAETEQGFVTRPGGALYTYQGVRFKLERDPTRPAYSDGTGPMRKIRIEPGACNVLASLALDSSVLDSPTFEDWASDYGYDSDSRSAESIYRACLEIALKLRAGLGDAALNALREACQDY